MRVISVPGRLRLVTFLVTLCVPLVAVETIIIMRAPWWNLPYRSIQIWTGAFALFSFPMAYWMAIGKNWALLFTKIFALAWCLASVWISIRTQNFWLGFFTLFLILFWLSVLSAIAHEMKRSFFDPKMDWFQGLPKPIPGVHCEVLIDKEGVPAIRNFRVCRIDQDGAFIYVDKKKSDQRIFPSRAKDQVNLKFTFRNQEIICGARPIRILESGKGIGLRFSDVSPDTSKDLGDFVETLRGEGYV